MIKRFKTAMDLLKKGKRVNNPAAWKKGQVAASCVSAFLLACVGALAAFTGVELEVAGETIDSLSVGLVAAVPALIAVWDAISTIITTNKVGLPSEPDTDPKRPNTNS
jgi:hypothetical protein